MWFVLEKIGVKSRDRRLVTGIASQINRANGQNALNLLARLLSSRLIPTTRKSFAGTGSRNRHHNVESP